MSRIGLGRHSRTDELADDPLDGLVNLFDLGLVLAVAFLVAGLSIGTGVKQPDTPSSTSGAAGEPQPIEIPDANNTGKGPGAAVGTVYRLPDGTLVLQEQQTATP